MHLVAFSITNVGTEKLFVAALPEQAVLAMIEIVCIEKYEIQRAVNFPKVVFPLFIDGFKLALQIFESAFCHSGVVAIHVHSNEVNPMPLTELRDLRR